MSEQHATTCADDALFTEFYPEPWTADAEDEYVDAELYAHGSAYVGAVGNIDHFPCFDGDPDRLDRACRVAARRIVACVNACQGLDLESLEAMPLGALAELRGAAVDGVLQVIRDREPREALVAQLREAHAALFGTWLTTREQMQAADKARAALTAATAFVEGGQS